MWIRSAYWIGAPKSGNEQAFRDAVDNELTPALRKLPGVQQAYSLWPQRREDGVPDVYCQMLVYFDSQAAIDAMLASSERKALRPRVIEVLGLFEGKMGHIDFEAV